MLLDFAQSQAESCRLAHSRLSACLDCGHFAAAVAAFELDSEIADETAVAGSEIVVAAAVDVADDSFVVDVDRFAG